MAITDSYATAAEYQGIKGGTTGNATLDARLLRQLKATSRFLERQLGQYFNKDASVTTRLYVGNGTHTIEVEPIASVTGLLVKTNLNYDGDFSLETAWTYPGDFVLLPINADKGPEPRPWTEIYIPGWSEQASTWPEGYQVQVTAIHGWPAVPEAIFHATIELTAMALRAEGPYASGQIQEMDAIATQSPQARAILKRLYQVYSRYPVAVG